MLKLRSDVFGRFTIMVTGTMLVARAGHLTTSIVEAALSLKRRGPIVAPLVALVPTENGASVIAIATLLWIRPLVTAPPFG